MDATPGSQIKALECWKSKEKVRETLGNEQEKESEEEEEEA
jgi:hypothetical protein